MLLGNGVADPSSVRDVLAYSAAYNHGCRAGIYLMDSNERMFVTELVPHCHFPCILNYRITLGKRSKLRAMIMQLMLLLLS